ncbi:MAG: HAD-IIIA family hydrolase [Planctomycetia bacterium]|nr:HAD-IIIA family hydrolase [Planctomycetia bacterium]
MNTQNLFFDLDGTLLDTQADIHECMLTTVREFGGSEDEFLKYFRIGPPLGDAVALAMPHLNHDDIDRFMARFRALYDVSPQQKTSVYPGMKAALATLKDAGKTLFIATNKRIFPTRRLLKMFELADFFSDVLAVDMNGKTYTKPQMLQYALDQYHLDAGHSIMIGDSRSDVRAGDACRMQTIAVTWGYEPEILLRQTNPGHVATDAATLLTVLLH